MTGLAVVEEGGAVARPLKILATLIKEDFEKATSAAQPFNEAAGEKLVEAQHGHFGGSMPKVLKWAEKQFGKTQSYLRTCIQYSGAGGSKYFKSQHNFKYIGKKEGGLGHNKPLSRPWTPAVDHVAQQARKDAFRLAQEEALTRAQEREAERKLAYRLIDIGYKVLAKELHPDKLHGDREAMRRLNRVRDILKGRI